MPGMRVIRYVRQPIAVAKLEQLSRRSRAAKTHLAAPDAVGGLRFGGWSRMFLARLHGGFHRADEDVRVAAFETRRALYRPVGGEVRGEAHQQLLAQIRVRDLASAKLHYGLHAIALLQEADGVILFEI